MKQEIDVGSNRWYAEIIKKRAQQATDPVERANLIEEWIREVKVIQKIQKGWEPWMGTPPHWLINRNRRRSGS
jgi:hypothetical protein